MKSDGNKHSFIKVQKKGRRPLSKNPYKVEPKRQLFENSSQILQMSKMYLDEFKWSKAMDLILKRKRKRKRKGK